MVLLFVSIAISLILIVVPWWNGARPRRTIRAWWATQNRAGVYIVPSSPSAPSYHVRRFALTQAPARLGSRLCVAPLLLCFSRWPRGCGRGRGGDVGAGKTGRVKAEARAGPAARTRARRARRPAVLGRG